ncbi:GDP-L-fucose synthase family protein [Candidatus Pelagibacter bacterium nBUS_44]|uniref:GDP-L-fucose synthase family protein n=1 Tax=Candidatus Pelagibacter bacterium nBUS_44 TaxID=3374195 RepID=UPI003EBA3626
MLKKITKNSKIFVAGHNGLVGSAIVRKLVLYGYKKILTISKKKLDLRNQSQVEKFFKKNKPDVIINAAATVGGIYANNTFGANFIYNNLAIQTNIIHASYLNNVKSLVFLGSSCVYPKKCNQPIKEKYLLNGELEKTNEPYAIAKIAGIKMCESYNSQHGTNYKCLMPTNTYGPNDNYDLLTSHFYPALIRKVHNAKIRKEKSIILWGNGSAKRELMYVDDLADACVFFMNKNTKESLINIGSGDEKTIKEFAEFIIKKIGLKIKIKFDKSKPNGTPRKLLDTSLAQKYGWRPKINLDQGFEKVYSSFLKRN